MNMNLPQTLLRHLAVLVFAFAASVASAQLAITEINSSSDATDDWFELTNAGADAVDVTGWGFDDYPEDTEKVVELEGVTMIAAGESAVFLQYDPDEGPLADLLAGFREAWGGLDGVQVGFHRGSGLGRDDGVSVFNATGELALQQIYFDPAADPAPDVHAGEWVGATKIDSAIWDPNSGVASPSYIAPVLGQYGVFAASDGGLGSPGLSNAVPEPSSSALALVALLAGISFRRRR